MTTKKSNTTAAPEFAIPAEYVGFPHNLFPEAQTPEEAYKMLAEHFVYLSTGATVDRKLTEGEIAEIRYNYTNLVENEKVEAKSKLMSVLANNDALKKKMKADQEAAESVLAGVETEIDDHVRMIKRGVTEMSLDAETSFRMAADGKYFYYTWTGHGFSLAKVEPIPPTQKGELFSMQDKNQEALTALFGVVFGESRFEKVEIDHDNYKKYIGRKLGAPATLTWMEDFIDEDTGEVVPIQRTNVSPVVENTVLTESDLLDILDRNIRSIVLYKAFATQAEPADQAFQKEIEETE